MKKKYFWGVFLVLAGAYLVVSQMGYLPTVGVFTILCTIACLAVLVGSIPHLHFAGILFPLAFIGILYDELLGITAITPWTILVAALLGTIGLYLLFGRFRKKYILDNGKCHIHNEDCDNEWEKVSVENQEGEYVCIKESFGATVRYINSEDLKKADIQVSFGVAKIYFEHAAIPMGNAVVDVKCRFGGVELYVPHNWQVINHIDSGFGAVDVDNERSGEVTATLTLCGTNQFGGINIIYV